MKILVIKFRNIGDVLLAGPLISALRRARPEAEIDALVKPGTEAMLQGHPDLGEVLVYPMRDKGEKKLAYRRREWAFLKTLRRRHYDLVINTTEGDRGAIVAFLSGARKRIGVAKPHAGWWPKALLTEARAPHVGLRHTVLRNLDLLPFADPAPDPRVKLAFGDQDRQRVIAKLTEQGWQPDQPLVQVHPTSRWFFKCWNDNDMARVIDHMLDRGLQVVLTSGPDKRERGKLDAILNRCHGHPFDLGGALSLKETAALSSLCRLFFGVDTAPMHMAAALDVPVVALFGPSGSFDWGPWPNGWAAPDAPYPQRGGVQHAGKHTVIQKDWSCLPCGRDGCQGTKRSACLEQTAAAEVILELDGALARALA